jgi:hypothetical protein
MFNTLPVEVVQAWLGYAIAIVGGLVLGLIWCVFECGRDIHE